MRIPVSVIVPHYNRPDRIGRALASIRSQTAQPEEILIVDDASTAENRKELARFEDEARIVWLKKNVGSAGARNEGVWQASCDTVVFLDDDDEWMPRKLELQWAAMEADPHLMASTTATLVVDTNTGEVLDVMHVRPNRTISLPLALEATPAMLQSLMIRKSAMRILGGFDPDVHYVEDHDFYIRLAASGLPNLHLSEPLLRLHRGAADHLTNQKLAMLKARLGVIEKHRDKYEAVFGPGGYRLARGAHIRWGGKSYGKIKGRTLFAWGAVLGRDWSALARLLLTGKMSGPPYSKLHGGPGEIAFRQAVSIHK